MTSQAAANVSATTAVALHSPMSALLANPLIVSGRLQTD